MSLNRRIAGAVLFTAAFASITPAALALPPVGDDPIIHCPKGYVLVDDACVKLPPPPPSISPVVTLGIPRQTVDAAAVRVFGRATDGDQPSAALTVQVRVDGVLVRTLTANQPDPPVATPNAFAATTPPTAPGHSYDATVPAPATANTVCVTAINVGSGSNTTVCQAVDAVVEFAGRSISYDLDHLQILDATLESLDRLKQSNGSNVQQSTTMSGEKTFTDTQGWTNTSSYKVTLSGGVKIPLITDFKVSVEGSKTFTKNGSTTDTTKFAWSQPILVPAHSTIEASIAVTKTTLTVPYTLAGDYVYASGARVAGTNGGSFTGVNSHDLEVNIEQFNLDGTPAAKPAQQPEAALLQGA